MDCVSPFCLLHCMKKRDERLFFHTAQMEITGLVFVTVLHKTKINFRSSHHSVRLTLPAHHPPCGWAKHVQSQLLQCTQRCSNIVTAEFEHVFLHRSTPSIDCNFWAEASIILPFRIQIIDQTRQHRDF